MGRTRRKPRKSGSGNLHSLSKTGMKTTAGKDFTKSKCKPDNEGVPDTSETTSMQSSLDKQREVEAKISARDESNSREYNSMPQDAMSTIRGECNMAVLEKLDGQFAYAMDDKTLQELCSSRPKDVGLFVNSTLGGGEGGGGNGDGADAGRGQRCEGEAGGSHNKRKSRLRLTKEESKTKLSVNGLSNRENDAVNAYPLEVTGIIHDGTLQSRESGEWRRHDLHEMYGGSLGFDSRRLVQESRPKAISIKAILGGGNGAGDGGDGEEDDDGDGGTGEGSGQGQGTSCTIMRR